MFPNGVALRLKVYAGPKIKSQVHMTGMRAVNRYKDAKSNKNKPDCNQVQGGVLNPAPHFRNQGLKCCMVLVLYSSF